MTIYAYDRINVKEFSGPLINVNVASRQLKRFRLRIKRFTDFTGAVVGIVLFSPIMLLIAISIKCTSRGKIIFKQERIGFEGRPFTFFKFRTMISGNDDKIHRDYVTKLITGEGADIQANNKGSPGHGKPMYKIGRDKRVTNVGGFLRTWSLDELPQLFNVLKGEMSLVGPRPPIRYEVEKYQAWHLQRMDAIPGMTGLWQVRGRSRTTFDEMVRLDIHYIKTWSLLLDIRILSQTIRAVVSREGAL